MCGQLCRVLGCLYFLAVFIQVLHCLPAKASSDHPPAVSSFQNRDSFLWHAYAYVQGKIADIVSDHDFVYEALQLR